MRKRVKEKYKSLLFYGTFVLLVSFYNAGNACITIVLSGLLFIRSKGATYSFKGQTWSGKVIVPLRVLTVDVSSTFCVTDQTFSRLYGSELGRRDSGVVCVTGQSLRIT